MRRASWTLLLVCAAASAARGKTNPLPLRNDIGPKKAIVAFVERVTKEGSPDFVPPAEQVVGSNASCIYEASARRWSATESNFSG